MEFCVLHKTMVGGNQRQNEGDLLQKFPFQAIPSDGKNSTEMMRVVSALEL